MVNRILFVVGMHRSGTSMVAGSLVALGCAAPFEMLPPTGDNPKGYFESSQATQLDDALLDALDRDWSDFGPLPSDRGDLLSDRVSDCAALLSDGFPEAPVKVMKDPRVSLLVPVWTAAARRIGAEPCFLFVLRQPGGTADSLLRRDGFGLDHGLSLWMRYSFEAEAGTRGYPRSFVTADDFARNPIAELQRVGRDLGLTWPVLPEAAAEALARFVEPDLLKHAAPPEAIMIRPARSLYDEIARLVPAPDDAAILHRIDLQRDRFDRFSSRARNEKLERDLALARQVSEQQGREIIAMRKAPFTPVWDLLCYQVLRVLAAVARAVSERRSAHLAALAAKRDPRRPPLEGKARRGRDA